MVRMNKKGVEMSMNLIIVAVICLIILVVLILIFSGAARKFVFGTSEGLCSPDKGGQLQTKHPDPSQDSCGTGKSRYLPGDSSDKYCCVDSSKVFT